MKSKEEQPLPLLSFFFGFSVQVSDLECSSSGLPSSILGHHVKHFDGPLEYQTIF
jgi:hypothetical protein